LDAVGKDVVEERGYEYEAGEIRVDAGIKVEAGGEQEPDAPRSDRAASEHGAEQDDGGDPEQFAVEGLLRQGAVQPAAAVVWPMYHPAYPR